MLTVYAFKFNSTKLWSQENESPSDLLQKSLHQIKIIKLSITLIEDGLFFVNWSHQLLTLSWTISR